MIKKYDIIQMMKIKNYDPLFEYINSEVLKSDTIKIVQSHLIKTVTITSNSRYVGIFPDKKDERFWGEPKIFKLENNIIVFDEYNHSTRESTRNVFDPNDKDMEFNFNILFDFGFNLSQIHNVLKYLDGIGTSIFCTYQK